MAASRTRSGLSFKPPEPAISSNIAAPVLPDHYTQGPLESFGTLIRPHLPQKPAALVIGSATTPGRTPPVVHFQPKNAYSAMFLVHKGTLAPIEEASDSSSSDSEEDSPQSHKNFPRPGLTAAQSPSDDASNLVFFGNSVRGVRPHGKSPFW